MGFDTPLDVPDLAVTPEPEPAVAAVDDTQDSPEAAIETAMQAAAETTGNKASVDSEAPGVGFEEPAVGFEETPAAVEEAPTSVEEAVPETPVVQAETKQVRVLCYYPRPDQNDRHYPRKKCLY